MIKNSPYQIIDFAQEIARLKKEKNAVILAHYYQEEGIQNIADFLGDSLYLAKMAEKAEADIIIANRTTSDIADVAKKVFTRDLFG